MPREKPIGVLIDEIRRTLEDLDGRRTGNGAGGRSGLPYSIIPNSSASRNTHQPRQEPVRVPLDEIRRTLEDMDRQPAETLALGRRESSRSTITRELASQIPVQPEKEPIRVRPDEAVARRNTVTVPEDELRRTIAANTQQHTGERFRERAARLRSQEVAGELDRRVAEEVRWTQPPATPERISSSPQIPILQAIPPPRKRLREPQPGGLLTPPPTRPDRPRKRPTPSQENALLQRDSLETILRYHESHFRVKEKESVARAL
ncbi:hypothetical protein FMUND_15632 [Fusarium mundagurra]|uniref:Uncharacterized protein n=1 Tax=Fusarium mundagurra TaxID=1567541 RepID=A0A8H6CY89_9HYPO|nr:hypothetical protein FMUND_15632 [Fusarium mundagurra]